MKQEIIMSLVAGMTCSVALAAETTLSPTGSVCADVITVADGDVLTIDLSGYSDSTPCRFTGGIRTLGSGKVVVSGADSILFGSATAPNGDVHYPLCSADIEFTSSGGKVVFDGWATIERVTSDFEINDDAWIAVWSDDPLRNGKSPFRVARYNVYLMSGTSIDPDVTITVASGRTLRIKTYAHNGTDYFKWAGINGTVANDIVLEEGSTLDVRSYNQLELTGDISGVGTLLVSESSGGGSHATLSGEMSFTGPVNIQGGQLILKANAVGAANPVSVSSGANATNHHSLSLEPDENADEVSVASFSGNHENAILRAMANQAMYIGTFSGTAELRGNSDTTSSFVVGRAEDGAKIYLRNAAKRVTVQDVGTDVSVVARKKSEFSGPVTIAFPDGQVITSLKIEDNVTVVVESGAINEITGEGKVVARGNFSYGTISDTVELVVEAGVAVSLFGADILESALGDKPALWLDASQSDTLQEYTYNGHTVPGGTFPGIVVRRWNDCRPGKAFYALNARSSTGNSDGGFIRTMPYMITNELNGLSVVSFGSYQGPISGAANQINADGAPGGANNEQRRLVFNKPIYARTVIMVYGSQDGGGRALIGVGGDANSNGEFKNLIGSEVEEVEKSNQNTAYYRRSGATLEYRLLASDHRIPFWMDGESVYAYNAHLSGGYQILSMGVAEGDDDPVLRSLGMENTYQNAGGQRYAEVLVYTNDLTSAQRVAVEKYLARKWGLLSTYKAGSWPKSVTVEDGATFESDAPGTMPVSGSGSVTVNGDVTAAGSFSGSVTLSEGAVLTMVATEKPLWTETQVSSVADRVGWFDPDCADDLTLDTTVNNPSRIHALFDHGNKEVANTPYLHGAYSGDANDRRPRLAEDVRGRHWMDLTDIEDKKGDNLRVKTNHELATSGDWGNTTLSVKTAFIVMDSSKGGGSPIIDKSTPGTDIKVRDYDDYTQPIWGANTGSFLVNGETRLNGETVDGRTHGFTGGPELFSFTTDDSKALNAGFFGYYNAKGEGGCEILGEIMLFSSVLDAETRENIEAYLMNKWLGTLPPAFAGWQNANVSGSGTVVAAQPSALPRLGNDFGGTVELRAEDLSFTLDGLTRTCVDALSVPGTLKLAETGTLSLSLVGRKVSDGVYTLATFGSLASPGLDGWTLPKVVNGRPCRVIVSATSIKLSVGGGFLIIVR